MLRIIACALITLLSLVCASSSNAEHHVHLSCSHGHTEQTTTFLDGHSEKKEKEETAAYPIDIDFEKKTINTIYKSAYDAAFENEVVLLAFVSQTIDPYSHGWLSRISIDRLTGEAVIGILLEPPWACNHEPSDFSVGTLGGWKGTDICTKMEITTIYRCVPTPF
jgi:hypothetical protein